MPMKVITLTGLRGRMGLDNPAALNCAAMGGSSQIRTGAEGQYSVCVFPDGSECEEWALYRKECTPVKPPSRLLNYGVVMGVSGLVGLLVAASKTKRFSYRALGAGVGAAAGAFLLTVVWPKEKVEA